jgi:hypothetical protein
MNIRERAVLGLLLEQHPTLLALDEVVRFIAPEPASKVDRDAVEEAVRALVQGGLAHRLDRFVIASVSAVYFARLDAG